MSRPCCFAISISASASCAASSLMRAASIMADSRMRAASSAASFTRRVADSSARSRICVLASRAVVRTRAASSPRSVVTVSSSRRPGADMPRVCIVRSSFSRKRSRSCKRASSAATIRRKSRTSPWSKPRRFVGNAAEPTAAGEDGSGREKEIAMTPPQYGAVGGQKWDYPQAGVCGKPCSERENYFFRVLGRVEPPLRRSSLSASSNVATCTMRTPEPAAARAAFISSGD